LPVGAVLAALIAGSVPASAAAQGSSSSFAIGLHAGSGHLLSVTSTNINARMRGSLVVRFHGDPGSGCAAHGLCGYSGTVIWTPAASASLAVLQIRTSKRSIVSVDLSDGVDDYLGQGGGTTHAVVQQSSPPGSSCADVASAGRDFGLRTVRDSIRFSLAGASLLQTRCAGPLTEDLESALPAVTRTLIATLRGHTTISFAGAHAFAAHGFAGTVSSTVELDLGKAGRPHGESPNGGFPGKRERVRVVTVRYAARVRGGLTASIVGDSIPGVCGPLGSCGARGTISLAIGTPHPDAAIEAVGPARRPYRDFLKALGISHGGDAKGIDVSGYVYWDAPAAAITADIAQGPVTCRDQAAGGGGSVLIAGPRGHLRGAYSLFGYESGLFRTRCPGPVGPQAQLTGAFEPGRTLAARTAVLSFTRPQPFSDDGYTGMLAPHVTMTLRRGRLHSNFEEVPKVAGLSADLARPAP
jgi:hypothetical protein